MMQLVCEECGAACPVEDRRWRCDCGGPFDLEHVATFARDRILERPPTLWRYLEALPVRDAAAVVTLDEGCTPLTRMELDGRPVLLKQDQLFPTGSYKDRGAAVLVSHLEALGVDEIVEDSSGNAGAALAAYAAAAGIRCRIFVPAGASPGKLAQIEAGGAELVRVRGSREDVAEAARKAAESCRYASHVWSPFFLHGTKTFAFEVWEQLGWRSPDTVVLPAGNGCLLLGAWIGFSELRSAGMIERIPKLVGVQAENCAPLAAAFAAGTERPAPIPTSPTVAEGMVVAEPPRGRQILAAVRASGGRFLTVSEKEILGALALMHRRGFSIEPTAAVTVAGVRRYLPAAAPGEVVVSVLTGHGLKAAERVAALLRGLAAGE